MGIEKANLVLENVVRNLVEEGDIFAITSGGLEQIKTGRILIQPNTFYYMGASSSPQEILVTKVGGGKITYRNYPYKQDVSIDERIGEHLIYQGVMTFLKSGYVNYPWGKERAEGFRKLLQMKKISQVDPKDWTRISVTVLPGSGYEGKDMWYEAEKYGSVGGTRLPDGEPGFLFAKSEQFSSYQIEMFRGGLNRLKKDKRFRIVSVKEI